MGKLQDKSTAFFEKIAPGINALSQNKYLQAISSGMMATLPITVVGSIAFLIFIIPIQAYRDAITAIGLRPLLLLVNNLTVGCIALYIAFLLCKSLVQQFMPEDDGSVAGVMSIACFLILTPMGTLVDEGGSAIPMTWLGAQGVFSAMIVALVCGRIYVAAKMKGWTIKMPDSVPPMVSRVFGGLIPSLMMAVLFAALALIFQKTPFGSVHQFVYDLLQKPFTNIGGSFFAMCLVSTFAQMLWFFGIHGTNVTNAFVKPIWLAMDLVNLEAVMAGSAAPNIVGYAFFMTYTFGGTALGLIANMLVSKSEQYKQLGRMAVVPALFGITEPVIYGTPLVLNFKLGIPFIFNNTIVMIIAYVLTAIGIVPRMMGTTYIFGLPLGFSAAIQGSIRIVLLQLALQVLSFFLWRPFFRMQEKESLVNEQA